MTQATYSIIVIVYAIAYLFVNVGSSFKDRNKTSERTKLYGEE